MSILTNMSTRMELTKENVKYPENLSLKDAVDNSGQTVKHIAKMIGVSRQVVSDTIHGHYKGINVAEKIKKHLGLSL